MTLNIRREPGILYDLTFIFLLKLNPEVQEFWLTLVASEAPVEKMENELKANLKRIAEIPRELKIFCYQKKDTNRYFLRRIREAGILSKDNGLNTVEWFRRQLAAQDLAEQVWDYYFGGGIPDDERVRGEIIDDSDLTLEMKYLAFSYFARPDKYQKVLLDTWDSIVEQYGQVYQEHANEVMECLQKLEEEDFKKITVNVAQSKIPFEQIDWSWVSISILNPYMIWISVKQGTVLLGVRYQRNRFHELVLDHRIPGFFDAMGSKQKRKIMRFLSQNQWVPTQRIVEEMQIQESSVVRHLATLTSLHLIVKKRVGKEYQYSLNEQQFQLYLEQLQQGFLKKDKH